MGKEDDKTNLSISFLLFGLFYFVRGCGELLACGNSKKANSDKEKIRFPQEQPQGFSLMLVSFKSTVHRNRM
eukprot:scaffold109541_cov50-Attheya_sp.AAC.4